MDDRSILNKPGFSTLLIAVLVNRLGGSIELTQEDIDNVASKQLSERKTKDGALEFRIVDHRH